MAQTDTHMTSSQGQRTELLLTAELVRKVADRVYELLQAEARLQAERQRLARSRWKRR